MRAPPSSSTSMASMPTDVLIATAASGTTPFTLTCLREARRRGALTVGIANNPDTPLLADAEHPILLATGPEPIAGSTRMNAGTAQRITLNLLSTLVMIRLGRIYRGMMVEVQACNAKLAKRREKMLADLTGQSDRQVREALRALQRQRQARGAAAAGLRPRRRRGGARPSRRPSCASPSIIWPRQIRPLWPMGTTSTTASTADAAERLPRSCANFRAASILFFWNPSQTTSPSDQIISPGGVGAPYLDNTRKLREGEGAPSAAGGL